MGIISLSEEPFGVMLGSCSMYSSGLGSSSESTGGGPNVTDWVNRYRVCIQSSCLTTRCGEELTNSPGAFTISLSASAEDTFNSLCCQFEAVGYIPPQ